jgi:uncharacterized repeat protein (TIGR01451 family)
MQRTPNSLRGVALLPLVALLAIQSAIFAAPAPANPDPVKVELTASKVFSTKGGRETLQPAESAKPGETLQYEAIYRNQSPAAIGKLHATLPIPTGLEVVLSSLKPGGAQASLDGTTFAPIPLTREVAGADGKKVRQQVPASEYRALRWAAPQLKAGVSFTVSARARVLINAPVAAR